MTLPASAGIFVSIKKTSTKVNKMKNISKAVDAVMEQVIKFGFFGFMGAIAVVVGKCLVGL
ncbi:hypothetical protein BECP10_00008 [Escherichia phage vB_EcoS-BECP10]|uniref:Uncharacterized protein n=1 Tax=Escherichia phage vB_EcoS-BECP10 TaxID=2797407 RepID=A0A7T7GU29_9CAUD|nr:hypothetical protein BECP10_00008 [Escherichia phage vB_EcoS-BECP10]